MGKETSTNPDSPLRIVDGRSPGWEKKAVAEANTKRNFIVILRQSEDLHELCALLDCSARMPEKLERWGIHALADVLEMKDFSLLLSLYEHYDIRIIEQLRLERNRPPRVKPFILYCELRGIISEHETRDQAGESLLTFLGSSKRARKYPLAGLYEFKNSQWQRLNKVF